MISPADRSTSDEDRTAGQERLKAAVAERTHARRKQEDAQGTAAEMETAVSKRAADEQVDARKRWLDWVAERDAENG